MNSYLNVFDSWQSLATSWSIAIAKSILVMFLGWWVVNKICKMSLLFFQKSIPDKGITSFLYSIVKFSLRVVLIITALGCLGVNVGSFFAAIGASFVAVGLSLKDNLSNLMSGMVLVINKPIHIGDYIEFENVKGTVIKIEMLFTTLQTEDKNKTVIIPNSKLSANSIVRQSKYDISLIKKVYELDNFSEKYKEIKWYFEKEFILNNKILQIPPPNIEFETLKDNKILLKINVWSMNKNKKALQEDVENSINRASQKYAINFKEQLVENESHTVKL